MEGRGLIAPICVANILVIFALDGLAHLGEIIRAVDIGSVLHDLMEKQDIYSRLRD